MGSQVPKLPERQKIMSPIRRLTAAGLVTAALMSGMGVVSVATAATASAASMVEYGTRAPAAAPAGRAWNGVPAPAVAPDGRAWN
jgi:hypothetical protein